MMTEDKQKSRETVEFAMEAIDIEKGFDRLRDAGDLIRDALYDEAVLNLLDEATTDRLKDAAVAIDDAVLFANRWWYEHTSKASDEICRELWDRMNETESDE